MSVYNTGRWCKHAAQRLKQWYGVDASPLEIQMISARINSGRHPSRFLNRGRFGTRVIETEIKGKTVKAVFDPRSGSLVTVLRRQAGANHIRN